MVDGECANAKNVRPALVSYDQVEGGHGEMDVVGHPKPSHHDGGVIVLPVVGDLDEREMLDCLDDLKVSLMKTQSWCSVAVVVILDEIPDEIRDGNHSHDGGL